MTLMTVVISGVATLCAWKINQSIRGVRLFALGMLAMGLGSVVGLAGAVIPGNTTAFAGTALRFCGMIGIVQGFREFRGFPLLKRTVLAWLAATVLSLYFYWLVVVDKEGLRLGLVSSVLALLAMDAARTMLRRVPPRDRPTTWPTGFIFVFISVPLSVRAYTYLSGSSGSVLAPLPVEIAWTICANIAFVVCAFSMLLASNAQLRHEAEDLALFDPLTNLPNRRFFQDRLLKAEQEARATNRRFGVIYLDMDGFKLVNDTLGHDAGDVMLRNISTAMAGTIGPGDCLARVGGDEFVVLVCDIEDRRELGDLAERLNAAVSRTPVLGKLPMPARASCGVALFPDDGISAHDVLREADFEMFQSKRRNRIPGHYGAA